jgi:hypothetical protein
MLFLSKPDRVGIKGSSSKEIAYNARLAQGRECTGPNDLSCLESHSMPPSVYTSSNNNAHLIVR